MTMLCFDLLRCTNTAKITTYVCISDVYLDPNEEQVHLLTDWIFLFQQKYLTSKRWVKYRNQIYCFQLYSSLLNTLWFILLFQEEDDDVYLEPTDGTLHHFRRTSSDCWSWKSEISTFHNCCLCCEREFLSSSSLSACRPAPRGPMRMPPSPQTHFGAPPRPMWVHLEVNGTSILILPACDNTD